MVGAIEKFHSGDVLLLHGCCHNPCGADLSPEEGVDTVVWLATADAARSSGGFYRRRQRIDW